LTAVPRAQCEASASYYTAAAAWAAAHWGEQAQPGVASDGSSGSSGSSGSGSSGGGPWLGDGGLALWGDGAAFASDVGAPVFGQVASTWHAPRLVLYPRHVLALNLNALAF
jgi:hypothetical protein